MTTEKLWEYHIQSQRGKRKKERGGGREGGKKEGALSLEKQLLRNKI